VIEAQQVEDHVADRLGRRPARDVGVAAAAAASLQPLEARALVVAQRDDFAVEDHRMSRIASKSLELGEAAAVVLAAPAHDADPPLVNVDDGAVAVPLELVPEIGVVGR